MMNKDTFIGFVLIGLILIGFSWYNQPSQEQVDAARIQDSIAAVMKENAAKKRQAEEAARKAQAEAAAKGDTTALFHVALNGSSRQVTLKNSKLELTLDTKGGVIKKARVLNFKDRNGQKDVTLFEKDEQSLTFMLSGKNENIVTSDLYFTPSEQTDTTVTMTAEAGNGGSIAIRYRLGKDYMLSMSLQTQGLSGMFAPNYNKVDIQWDEKCRQQEKGFTFENRYATLTYKEKNSGTDYLNETKEIVDEKIESSLDWVAFKNQFFSAVLISKDDFAANALMTSISAE